MGYNLLVNGVYWGYNPLTNHLLTSWDIPVVFQDSPNIYIVRRCDRTTQEAFKGSFHTILTIGMTGRLGIVLVFASTGMLFFGDQK